MSNSSLVPMFPLTLLPLPGELVPLHIFEPRYKQLLQEAEANDISFGIYYNHQSNTEKVGSLMKLESIIKRYSGGELDIIVKCIDIFTLNTLHRTFKDRLYPGGNVNLWGIDFAPLPGETLYTLFNEYLTLRKITQRFTTFNIYHIATELNLDLESRYKFLIAADDKKEIILLNRLKFLIYLLEQEIKSKDVFHLN